MSETGAELWRYWKKGKIDADLLVFMRASAAHIMAMRFSTNSNEL